MDLGRLVEGDLIPYQLMSITPSNKVNYTKQENVNDRPQQQSVIDPNRKRYTLYFQTERATTLLLQQEEDFLLPRSKLTNEMPQLIQ